MIETVKNCCADAGTQPNGIVDEKQKQNKDISLQLSSIEFDGSSHRLARSLCALKSRSFLAVVFVFFFSGSFSLFACGVFLCVHLHVVRLFVICANEQI